MANRWNSLDFDNSWLRDAAPIALDSIKDERLKLVWALPITSPNPRSKPLQLAIYVEPDMSNKELRRYLAGFHNLLQEFAESRIINNDASETTQQPRRKGI